MRPTTNSARKRLLADAQRVIGTRYREFDFGVADLAEELGCSTRQLQRVFREVGGTDFRSYLLSVRMERARQLLSQERGAPSVRATARQVGYREASGLRQRFKPFFGVDPSAVRTETIDYDQQWRDAEKRS